MLTGTQDESIAGDDRTTDGTDLAGCGGVPVWRPAATRRQTPGQRRPGRAPQTPWHNARAMPGSGVERASKPG